MTDVSEDLIEAAQENLGAESQEETIEMALFLALVIENPAEVLEVHGCVDEQNEN